ncbi:hypothetical protein [Nostoc sp.]|uniref:hypothetical protein n=1 Tax=Nostoc sp. TaxID=1180 RepID=UPI002FFB5CE2
MPKHISAIVFVLIFILGFASPVQAATPRSTWVENEILPIQSSLCFSITSRTGNKDAAGLQRILRGTWRGCVLLGGMDISVWCALPMLR